MSQLWILLAKTHFVSTIDCLYPCRVILDLLLSINDVIAVALVDLNVTCDFVELAVFPSHY